MEKGQLSDIMRPKTLDELIGNEHIRKILKGQFESGNVSHTFLLVGGYGRGKTTIARIIANSLHAEIIEHDAGAKSDIDTIREVVASSYSTSIFSDKKVYIFDEVHKLSKDAQTVLLKVTEEPPEDVYFILSTSESDKVIPALASRAIKLEVEPLTVDGVRQLVARVTDKFRLVVENRQDWMKVVKRGEGSLRVVYNLIEALMAAGEKNHETGETYISSEVFDEVLGDTKPASEDTPLVKLILSKDLRACLQHTSQMSKTGVKSYGQTLAVYNYLKKVDPVAHRALLTELAFILYDKDRANSWEGIEYALLKAL